MTDIRFGRLVDLPLRDAWKHEAHQFTPWLADNIDHLSDAIGIPLELTGTEVAVETFSADILARNPMDDSIVLIENQLETTDHTHLGQIMTYLAGLEAQTVVWIAPAFREPHLSAIRWLNEHTADGFSFFAIKARVVRIGDSPYAPIFEVVEKPDKWLRKLQTEVDKVDLKPSRHAYFAKLTANRTERYEQRGQALFFPIEGSDGLNVVIGISRKRVDIYVAPDEQMDFGLLSEEILKTAPSIETALGPIREARWGGALFRSTACQLEIPGTWPDTLAWHSKQLTKYLEAFRNRGEADL
ncbi:MAG: hypothetical protein ACU0A4_16995 [Paracoccaceae bacterium]